MDHPSVEWRSFYLSARHHPHDVAHYKRIDDLLKRDREQFLMAYRDSDIVRSAMDIAAREELREEDAWLLAVIALLEQNRALMENAKVRIPAPEVIECGPLKPAK